MKDVRESTPRAAEALRTRMLGAAVALLFLGLVVIMYTETAPESAPEVVYPELPDFAAISDVREKKQAFFRYLEPMIEAHNTRVRMSRRQLEAWRAQRAAGDRLGDEVRAVLAVLGERYRVDVPAQGPIPMERLDALLACVDVIPPSLVLAQAATESAWGTSRFAREANNLFGEWCFTAGCGLVPNRRSQGATHEVERFATVSASIDSYFHNLNSHPAYAELRAIRARARQAASTISGADLAAGLTLYSERGEDYVDELRLIIRVNDLGRFDSAPATRTARAD